MTGTYHHHNRESAKTKATPGKQGTPPDSSQLIKDLPVTVPPSGRANTIKKPACLYKSKHKKYHNRKKTEHNYNERRLMNNIYYIYTPQ